MGTAGPEPHVRAQRLLSARSGFRGAVPLAIDDQVVLRVQAELDNEELGLTGALGPE